jgi:drug/metabolite transporter (DMT)-like permease
MYALYLPLFALLARRSIGVADVVAVLRSRSALVMASAAVAFLSYVLILQAMVTAPVSYITAVRQSSILFALGLAFFALRERPGRIRLLGALTNVAGVALIALSR